MMGDDQFSPRALRPRRSKSSTPIGLSDQAVTNHTPNGNIAATITPLVTPMVTPTPHRMTPSTPGIDASYRTGDKISPMLAKLRMTPGTTIVVLLYL